MFPPNGTADERLNALFRAYRDACVAPDPSPNFMPEIWQKIEARQKSVFAFGRVARVFVTAAMALTVAMAVYLSAPHNRAAFYTESYVEALASGPNADIALASFDADEL